MGWQKNLLITALAMITACANDPPGGSVDLGGDMNTGDSDGGPGGFDLGASDLGDLDLGGADLGDLGLGDTGPGNLDLGGIDLGDLDIGGVDLGLQDLGNGDIGAFDQGTPDLGLSDLGFDLGAQDTGILDLGVSDAGQVDAGPPPVTCTEPGLVTQVITDSASVGTPDTYFFNVNPSDPFCAQITGGGNGSWGVTVSNGTSVGIYCNNITPCRIRIPPGELTVLVTALTSDIGFYTLTVQSIPR